MANPSYILDMVHKACRSTVYRDYCRECYEKSRQNYQFQEDDDMIGGGVIGGSTAGNMMAGNPMSGGAPAMSPSLSIPYGKAVNPWAVCHASVGPSKSKKFEDCVREVKSKNHIKS